MCVCAHVWVTGYGGVGLCVLGLFLGSFWSLGCVCWAVVGGALGLFFGISVGFDWGWVGFGGIFLDGFDSSMGELGIGWLEAVSFGWGLGVF